MDGPEAGANTEWRVSNDLMGYEDALAVMEQRLSGAQWLVGDAPSLADIALYAYTHVTHEGGFDLAGYPAIGAWLGRVAAHPGHIPIDRD